MKYMKLVKRIYSRYVDLSTATRDSFYSEKKNGIHSRWRRQFQTVINSLSDCNCAFAFRSGKIEIN